MKFRLVDDLCEVYFSPSNLDRHYSKHVESDEDGEWKFTNISKEEYNELADKLSSAPAKKLNDRSANIIGYITKDGRTVKHDKQSGLTVTYVDDDEKGHEAISLYRQPTRKFFSHLNNPNHKAAFGKNLY